MSDTQGPSNKKSNFFSEWLEQLQQESWQLELLISGLALFGIWESRGTLRRLEYYFEVNATNQIDNYTDLFLAFLWVGWAIFLINLLIHIIIRGLWIGAIGLRYVSGEIDFDELNYSERFIRHYKKSFGSFDNYIERLEKYSSVLFSYTFLLFFMFLSFGFIIITFALSAQIIEWIFGEGTERTSGFIGFFALLYFGIGFIVLVDFLTLGALKKVKDNTFSLIYYWIYKFYSTVTLSFVFRPLLLNFIDNKFTRRLFFLSIPYALILFLGFRNLRLENNAYIPSIVHEQNAYFSSVQKSAIAWNSYDDLREEHFLTFNNGDELPPKKQIRNVSMDTYEQDDNTIRLFIRYYGSDKEHVEKYSGYTPFREEGVRHNLFFNKKPKDPKIESLEATYAERRKLLTQIVRNQNFDFPDSTSAKFSDDIAIWKTKDKEDLSTLRSELQSDFEAQMKNLVEDKFYSIIQAIHSMYTYKIDDIEIQPEHKSYFYTHPNMHERGIICYFNLDSIPPGSHEFKIKKQRYRSGCDEDLCAPSYIHLPFRKI